MCPCVCVSHCGVNQFKVASADALAPASSRLLADVALTLYIEVLSPQIISLSGISQNEHHLKMSQEISHIFLWHVDRDTL